MKHNIKYMLFRTFWIFIIFLLPVNIQQQDNNYLQQKQKQKLQRFDGSPTTMGIDTYIKLNEANFIRQYQDSIRDTIYNDIYFKTMNFKKYFKEKYNPQVLAFNVVYENTGCEITVNDEEKYSDFDYASLKYKNSYNENQYFLKATVFHEITHYYFYQCIVEMQRVRHLEVSSYYQGILQFPNQELIYGAKFIEEGICEYVVHKYGFAPEIRGDYTPKSKAEIIEKDDKYDIVYGYSSQYLKEFLDEFNRLKDGLIIILSDRPPNYQEILQPSLYFQRLKQKVMNIRTNE